MKKINLGFFALALALCASTFANAATVSIGGAGEKDPSVATTGTLEILFDTAPQNFTLLNGGTFFGLSAATPGVIEITSATVINGGRWATASASGVTANGVQSFNASSVGGGGMPTGPSVLFATVNYNIVGAPGSSTALNFVVGEEAIVEGAVGDVTSLYNFLPATISVKAAGPVVPEPATLAMLGTGLIGLILRRRNG